MEETETKEKQSTVKCVFLYSPPRSYIIADNMSSGGYSKNTRMSRSGKDKFSARSIYLNYSIGERGLPYKIFPCVNCGADRIGALTDNRGEYPTYCECVIPLNHCSNISENLYINEPK